MPTPAEIAAAYGVPAEKRRAARGRRDLGRLRGAPRAATRSRRKASRGSMIYTSGTTGRPKGVRRRPSHARAAGGGRQASRQVLGHQGRSLDRGADERADVPLGARRLRHGQRAARPQHGAAAALRGRGHAAADRSHKVSHMHIVPTMFVRLLRLPDEVKRALRRLVAALDHPRRRALRARGEAPDDRLVGTGHQRILRRHRDRHRGVARFGRRRSPSPARSATSSTAPRCASSTRRAAT